MSRYIDADALKEEVLKWLPSDPCGIAEKEHPVETDIVVSLIMEIDSAPSIDIVRCKECKCGKPYSDKQLECDALGLGGLKFPDDFCSYGERKEP